ncbi:putative endolysin [Bacillus phage BSP2]|uniref:Endolysin n=1 Tax=Bacillus phage BSTP4 TaxID=2801529 RepID=A0A7T8EP28_9CAUD|nr:putative endolysin [Bacillus phage BSP4]AYJ76495.1 putative endolysin [Bacillus phage BSP2]QQO90053.1 DNA packaging protein [Bacillus phage BSTP4]
MQISQAGINLIKSFEGLQLKAYKAVPTEKHYTIGYGHYGSDVSPRQVITAKQAEDMLRDDVQAFVDGVNKALKVSVTQNQFDALVSFAYNVGLGAFRSSSLLEYLNEGRTALAAAEFPKWNKSGGKVYQGLINRRAQEQALFNSGTPKNVSRGTSSTKTTPKYKVKSGDNLTKIAKKHNTTVATLLKLNPGIKDPNMIRVGQTLNVTGSGGKTHKVKSGDTLSKIAVDNKTTVSKLMNLNPEITNPNHIKVGQTIRLS